MQNIMRLIVGSEISQVDLKVFFLLRDLHSVRVARVCVAKFNTSNISLCFSKVRASFICYLPHFLILDDLVLLHQ